MTATPTHKIFRPKMLIADSSFVCCNKLCCLISNRINATKQFVTFSKKKDYSENSATPTPTPKKAIFPLISSRNLIIQSAVGVFALGFIDAGYSGDWSRIGVISRGTEDLLKTAAFFLVPLCFFLIFYLFKNDGQEESR